MDAIVAKIVAALLSGLKSPYLVTLIISMIPMIEVRGSIPMAVQMGVEPWAAFLLASVSALLICPLLILVLRPLLNALKRTKLFKKIAVALEEMFKSKAKSIEDKAEAKETGNAKRKVALYKMLGILAFVAIPLPMTGVWTGTAIAVFINMDTKQAMIPIVVGNFIASGLITIMTVLLGDKSYIILVVLCAFVAISLIGIIVKLLISSRKKAKAEKTATDGEKQNETASNE